MTGCEDNFACLVSSYRGKFYLSMFRLRQSRPPVENNCPPDKNFTETPALTGPGGGGGVYYQEISLCMV